MNKYQQIEFDKLKSFLEGATIVKIEEPNAPEAICKFVLQDGTAFRLHATELFFWIEETSPEGKYSSLDVLIKDLSHHMFFDLGFSDEDISISKSRRNNKFIFSIRDKEFIIAEGDLSEVQKIILNSDIGINLLKEAIPTGDFWKINFCVKNKDCPPEFYLE